jgi:hypothetical protein
VTARTRLGFGWPVKALVAGALMVGLAGSSLAADKPEFAKWFRHSADVEAAWQISGTPDDALKVSVSRKGDQSRIPLHRVMVLYPRPSSAYDIAITKILHVFEGKEVNAEITVVNFEMDDRLGDRAIRLAEAGKYELIFGMGSESTAWLYDHYRDGAIPGAIPVVSVCSKDPVQLGQIADYDHGSGTNFAFTSRRSMVLRSSQAGRGRRI